MQYYSNQYSFYYCDVRASNQKAMCEKNHVEIHKIILKRSKVDFDELDTYDVVYISSHINSQPRKSRQRQFFLGK